MVLSQMPRRSLSCKLNLRFSYYEKDKSLFKKIKSEICYSVNSLSQSELGWIKSRKRLKRAKQLDAISAPLGTKRGTEWKSAFHHCCCPTFPACIAVICSSQVHGGRSRSNIGAFQRPVKEEHNPLQTTQCLHIRIFFKKALFCKVRKTT